MRLIALVLAILAWHTMEPVAATTVTVTLAALAAPMRTDGTLGLNMYFTSWMINGIYDPVADSAALKTFCRRMGYLWMASKEITSNLRTFPKDPTAVAVGYDASCTEQSFCFMSEYRLPNSLDPAWYDTAPLLANAQMLFTLGGVDDQKSQRLDNLDQAIVKAGDLVVAVMPQAADVSEQLNAQMSFPFIGTAANTPGRLVIGIANTTAQDGVYQNPFSAASAFANLGPARQQVPIIVQTETPGATSLMAQRDQMLRRNGTRS